MARSAALANVAASATSVAVFPAAGGVGARTVHNDSAAILYLKFGAIGTILAVAPRMCALLSGQADLPSSFADASLSNAANYIYAEILP